MIAVDDVANVGLMLGQRCRRWPNIDTSLGERMLYAVNDGAQTICFCYNNVMYGDTTL